MSIFGFFGGPRKKIIKAYNAMRNAHSPDEMLHRANEMLEIVESTDNWPFDHPSKEKVIGAAYGISGLAYLQLGFKAAHLSDQTITVLKKAIEYMQSEPDIDLVVAYLNLSSAYASSPSGSRGENIENSIRYCQNALDLLDYHDDASIRIDALSALASYYVERQLGNPKNNLEKAKSLAEEALQIQSRNISQAQLAHAEMTLGKIYEKRVKGDPQDNIEIAIEKLESALDRTYKSKLQEPWALINANLATLYSKSTRNTTESAQLEKALAANSNALSVFTREHDPKNWAKALTDRAMLITKTGTGVSLKKHNEAVTLFKQALEILNINNYPQEYAKALHNYSIILGSRINPEISKGRVLATQYARDALKAYNIDKDPISWARANMELGSAIFNERSNLDPEEYEESITCTENALKLITPDVDLERWIIASSNLADFYAERKVGFKSNNIEKAIEIQTNTLDKTDHKLFRKSWLSGMRSLALSYLSRLEGFVSDNVEYAIVLTEEALIVAHDTAEPNERADLLETLGDALIHRVRGNRKENLERAVSSFEEAKYLRLHLTNIDSITRLKLKLTGAYQSLQSIAGSRDEKETFVAHTSDKKETNITAEEFLDRLTSYADSISKENYPSDWAHAQITIASALRRYPPSSATGGNLDILIEGMLTNCEQSISYYENALSVINQDHDPDGTSFIFEKIGAAYYSMFYMSEAKDYGWGNLHKLTEIEVPNRSKRASKFLSQSIYFYKKSQNLPCRGKSPAHALSLNCRIGECYFMQRDWRNAHEYFKNAATMANQLLGDVAAGQQDLEPVLQSMSILAEHAPFCALKLGNIEEAIVLNEAGRARLLAKSLTLRTLPFAKEELAEIYSLQNEIAIQEQRLVSDDTFDRRAPLEEIMRLRKVIRETVFKVTNLSENFLDYNKQINALVSDGTVVVMPIINNLAGQLLVFHKNTNQTEMHQIKVGDDFVLRNIFDSKIEIDQDFKRIIEEESYEEMADFKQIFTKNINELSEVIVNPLVEFLKKTQSKSNTKILFLAHGSLSMLPINLVSTDTLGAPIIEHFELTFSPSLRASYLINSSKNRLFPIPESATILSRPILENDKNNLPYAPIERKLVKSWFSGKNVIQIGYAEQTISESEILNALDGSDVWHICAHAGFDDKEPLNSNIDLGIATVSLKSIFNTSSLKPPRLVVLSACDTAFHGTKTLPQEFVGMPTAFLQLGATGVIATRWSIGDLSTTLLLGKFYELFIRDGLRPSEALRRSQLWLRDVSLDELNKDVGNWEKENRLADQDSQQLMQELNLYDKHPETRPYDHPYYWGAFAYFGE